MIFCRAVWANCIGVSFDESVAAKSALKANLAAFLALPETVNLCGYVDASKESKCRYDETLKKFMEFHLPSLLSVRCYNLPPSAHRVAQVAMPYREWQNRASP